MKILAQIGRDFLHPEAYLLIHQRHETAPEGLGLRK